MFRALLPKNTDFFDFFEQHSDVTIKTCEEFLKLTSGTADRIASITQIKRLEHEADTVTHRCIEALHKTFITPIDRYDIHGLIKRMDDVVDCVDATSARIALYEIGEMRPEAGELAEVLYKAVVELGRAIRGLRDMKNAQSITQLCIAIHQFENDGDVILRKALVRLFKEETDTVLIIKWKEIYERLEKATDCCDDVANIIEGVIIEAS